MDTVYSYICWAGLLSWLLPWHSLPTIKMLFFIQYWDNSAFMVQLHMKNKTSANDSSKVVLLNKNKCKVQLQKWITVAKRGMLSIFSIRNL